METRFLIESDYDKLLEWWKFWRFSAPPKESLPDNGLSGIMLSIGGIDACAGFIYYTNSNMCWIEFIVSNPEIKENRREMIVRLIEELCGIASLNGVKVAYTSIKSPTLINHYYECGFVKGSSTVTEMVRLL